MTAPKRIAVVTGSNKGIGLEIVRQLACNGVMVFLTARDVKRGNVAAEKLIKSGVSDVLFHQLDVTDPASVAALAEFIKTKFGKLDILEGGDEGFYKIVGAAKETYEKAVECLNTNYYGAKRVTEALLPLLQLSNAPRIVNLTSLYGQLEHITNESIQKQLSDVNGLTEEKLDDILNNFLDDLQKNKLQENGWPFPISAYKVSKIAINTYTRMLANKNPRFCINCVHPGLVNTDINWNTGTLTVEEGARCPVALALLPDGSPSGLFYENMEVVPF
ncbi:hypothetical protein J5N97_024021 [Dioscorea zingiberensis]|uniref:Uncharacterized protein n=1 Tax=Dioscorea zingiberensis TaxID=325984 RepID=A0A9D5C6C9_9LILI|nr:hypothetical protein J5N97_024021 [Dioscorea zingiberensis]